MNILTEDEALKIFKAEDSIANDEERWVTINGRHVLIRNGEPVGLNISKATPAMKGGKFRTQEKEVKKQVDEFGKKTRRLDRENRKSEKQYQNEIDELTKEEEKLNSGKKGLKHNLKLGEAAVRLAKTGGEKYKNLIKRIGERRSELSKQWLEENEELGRRARSSYDRHVKRTQANSDKINKYANEMNSNIQKAVRKYNAAESTLEKARPKIQSAREANRYLAERSSNIKKATPDMVGGKFRNISTQEKVIGKKPTLEQLENAPSSSSFMKPRASIDAGSISYKKIGKDKWERELPGSSALGGTRTSSQVMSDLTKYKDSEVSTYGMRTEAEKKKANAAKTTLENYRKTKKDAAVANIKKRWNDTINEYNKRMREEKDPKKRHVMYREYNKKLSEIEKEKRQLKN